MVRYRARPHICTYTFASMRSFKLVALMSLASVFACTEQEQTDGLLDDAYTSGSFIRANAPSFWVDSSYEDFLKARSAGFPTPLPAALPAGHALTARAQAWLDRIDAIVRAEVLKNDKVALVAPKPLVKILPSPDMYAAFTLAVPTCVGAPFGAPVSTPSGLKALAIGKAIYVGNFACATPAGWRGAADLATSRNALSPLCRLNVGGDGVIRSAGATCSAQASADQTVVQAASKYIHLSTDFMAAVDEPSLVVTLAHELGHYYRAHAVPEVTLKYNFWYETSGGDKRPVSAAEAEQLKRSYAELLAGPRTVSSGLATTYSPRMGQFLITQVVPRLAERTEPQFVCAAARDAAKPVAAAVALGDQTILNGDRFAAKYVEFERALKSCATRLALTGAEPNAVSGGDLAFAARGLGFSAITLRPGDTLSALLTQLDTEARNYDTKAAALASKVKANKIGLFTAEQEADDIALDVATKLGFKADEVLQAFIVQMRALEDASFKNISRQAAKDLMKNNGVIDADVCAAYLAADFKSDNGAARTISLGDLNDTHHAGCYRVFNLWRESRTHSYPVGPAQPALSPSWAAIRAQAAQLK